MADIALSGWYLGTGDPLMDIQNGSLSVPFPFRIGNNGKMGFQLEGGVITVNATSPNINVSFDRPMVYDGAHNHVPSGTPYDIGTPSLATDARSLDIPINVATITPTIPNILSSSGSGDKVEITFDADVNVGTPTFAGTVLSAVNLSSTIIQLTTLASSGSGGVSIWYGRFRA